MAWEQRRGHWYYFRSVRTGDGSRKVYVGRGAAAQEAARQVEQDRIARLAQREAIRVEQLRYALADSSLRDLRTMLQTLVRATLIALGYHCHHRGEWRRRRGYES